MGWTDAMNHFVRWLWLDPSAGWIRLCAMLIMLAIVAGVSHLLLHETTNSDKMEDE